MKLTQKCAENNGTCTYKSNGFVLRNKILYYVKKLFNKDFQLIVLPEFLAKLVLNHLHFTRRLHISAFQLSRVFLMNFFSFNLHRLSQDVCNSCLPCTTNKEAYRNHRELGPQKSLMIARPNFAYQGDVAYMPPSNYYVTIFQTLFIM